MALWTLKIVLSHSAPMRQISLTIHSSLEAVGLTAAISAALTQAGVPHEGHIYPAANHGFHNDTTPRYDGFQVSTPSVPIPGFDLPHVHNSWEMFGVGGQVEVVAHLDHSVKVLGFLAEHGKVYCCDKGLNVSTFALDLNLVKYKAAISVHDLATAESLFAAIPEKLHTKVARVLESQGFRSEALEITKDVDHRQSSTVPL